MFCYAKVIAVEMECFNDLLHKLKEVHEREIEGKWNKKNVNDCNEYPRVPLDNSNTCAP